MSFIGAAVIGATVAAPIAGASAKANAATTAAQQQQAATAQANTVQKQMYDQSRSDQQPFVQAGQSSLSAMQNPNFQKSFSMSDYQQDPGYQFRLQQGQQALDRSAAARGGLLSGGALKGAQEFGQNMASQEYQNAYNRFNQDQNTRFGRLSTIAGMGQNATNMLQGANTNYGNAVSSNFIGAGNAQAAGTIGAGNAWGGAAEGIGKNLTSLGGTALGFAAGG